MTKAIAIALFLCAAGASGCKKSEQKAAEPASAPASGSAAPASAGPRKIAIAVDNNGYTPERIPGKPGEKLTLVFTRTVDASCIAQLKAPDGKLVDLPMNQAVEVAVTVPQAGEVGFACGMDMFHGVVVAQPAS